VAAKRAGIRVLIVPKENKGDFDELPDFVKEGFEVHFVDYFDDVIRIIFRNNLEALNLSKLRDAAE
jgi:ATP-dependent Lon protease